MDCGVDYIEMCEKAEEIQKYCDKKDKYNDFAIFIMDKDWIDVAPNEKKRNSKLLKITKYEDNNRYGDSYDIWLPRQDQLQDMLQGELSDKNPCHVQYCLKRVAEIVEYNKDNLQLYKSMEQFWLRVVMKEKYKKIWKPKQELPGGSDSDVNPYFYGWVEDK